eukprot:CAMPEP_0176405440 /NCGR_PEP_ID=MMETSP0127-20121128/337_1 /TAXON_ID=938130 /ORGANISM="Platyophrya macrostoma, Strain WH" /LENGTH=379 /DNA_ID=CAMNT_0017784495 /DNA_START=121 /DNA_END=1257 /DNA_ORIENTATION=+
MLKDARGLWFALGAVHPHGNTGSYELISTMGLGDMVGNVHVDEVAVDARVAYDVIRFRGGNGLFFEDHIRRLHQGVMALCETNKEEISGHSTKKERWFELIADGAKKVAERQQQSNDEQNVKIIVWSSKKRDFFVESESQREVEVVSDQHPILWFSAFFIDSFYPPKSWYTPSLSHLPSETKRPTLACLYQAARDCPELKIVQAALRQRAVEQQKQLGVFESLLVHGADDGFRVPEGSRSNFILVTSDGRVVSSLEVDILMGITLVAMRRRCKDLGRVSFEHKRLGLRDVVTARSICMLGTSVGVLPIESLVVFSNVVERQQFEAAMAVDGCSTTVEHLVEVGGNQEHEGRAQLDTVGRILYKSSEDPIVQELIHYYEE